MIQVKEKKITEMQKFRLKVLRIKENEIFKKEISFDFFDESTSTGFSSPFITLVLGPNGTGKSNLLKILIDIFRIAYEKSNHSEIIHYPNGKYYLEYELGNSNYVILNTVDWECGCKLSIGSNDNKTDSGIRFFRNSNETSTIEIPESILASSIMLTDKFLFLKDNGIYPVYKYLGVRKDNNSAGTRYYIGKTIEHVFAAAGNKEFLKNLSVMLSFLELKEEFLISYSPKYKNYFFISDLTVSKFEDFFFNYTKYLPKRTTEPWSVGAFKQLKQKEPTVIPKLVKLLKYLSSRLVQDENSKAQYFEFDVFKIQESFLELFPLLPYLHRLNIISFPEITLRKDRYYGIAESSSGEYHFISTIVSLLSKITKNSLVLIDEPEISLHPNWQMRYISFLNEIFKHYKSAHFLICSHSHFLVSDLKPKYSAIISLKRDVHTTATMLTSNTFGWSAEEVLYSVFNVRSTRNSFLEYDLTKLVTLVNRGSDDYVEIRRIVSKISNLELSESDPLRVLKEKAQNYLEQKDA